MLRWWCNQPISNVIPRLQLTFLSSFTIVSIKYTESSHRCIAYGSLITVVPSTNKRKASEALSRARASSSAPIQPHQPKFDMGECFFTNRLPVEIRLRIYELVLSFSKPLKLRQYVDGTINVSILRTNRQIHDEATAVFYDLNTIVTTRNDFCHHTGADLKTPLNRSHVRHLLIVSFNRSIKCSSPAPSARLIEPGCCSVCDSSAAGFVHGLLELPRLRSAVVDYSKNLGEFASFHSANHSNPPNLSSGGGHGQLGFELLCTGVAQYKLIFTTVSPSSPTVIFIDLPFNRTWNTVLGMDDPLSESKVLEIQGPFDTSLASKLWFVHNECTLSYDRLISYDRIAELKPLINAMGGDASNRPNADEAHALTRLLRHFVQSKCASIASTHLDTMVREQRIHQNILPVLRPQHNVTV